MYTVPAICFLASLGAAFFAWHSDDYDTRTFAISNVIICVWAVLSWFLGMAWLIPYAEGLIMFAAVVFARFGMAFWLRVYAAVMISRMGLHAFIYVAGPDWWPYYSNALAATFAVLVVCVALPGFRNGCLAMSRNIGLHMGGIARKAREMIRG